MRGLGVMGRGMCANAWERPAAPTDVWYDAPGSINLSRPSSACVRTESGTHVQLQRCGLRPCHISPRQPHRVGKCVPASCDGRRSGGPWLPCGRARGETRVRSSRENKCSSDCEHTRETTWSRGGVSLFWRMATRRDVSCDLQEAKVNAVGT